MTRRILLLAVLFFVSGCTRPPLTELATARSTFAQATVAEAGRLAPEDYRLAAETLGEGERLVAAGRNAEARQLLPLATSRASRALTLAQNAAEQQRRAEELRTRELALARTAAPKPAAPAPSRAAGAVTRLSPTPLHPVPPLPSYTVEDGDTLWSIAAQPRVYGDPLLWPLLYKANRDQIRDPRQVYAGQVLSIPRDRLPAEQEEARQTARHSTIFPLARAQQDLSYHAQ